MSESQNFSTAAAVEKPTQRKQINPAIILLSIVLLAVAFTYAVNSGKFERQNGLVVPGSYQVLEKHDSLGQLFALEPRKAGDTVARPVSLVEGFMAIPKASRNVQR